MQQHTRHFWTHQKYLNKKVVQLIFSSNFVFKVRHSLDLWCFQDIWELGKQGKIMMSVIFRLELKKEASVPDLEFWVGWPWKTYFPSRSKSFSESTVVLTSLIFQFRVSSCFERCRSHAGLTAWPMYSTISGPWCCVWMFIFLILEKRPLNPDLDHTPSPPNSWGSKIVIALPLIPSKPLLLNLQYQTCCVMFMSYSQWAPIHFAYNLSSYDKELIRFTSRLSTWFMMMTACLAR
jgi:hypothetical protein